MQQVNKRAVTDIDAHLGRRIKLARTLSTLSQTNLAEALDITFQQVQKYENGVNRVPASRLFHIAQALGQEIGFFYADCAPELTDNTADKEQTDLTRAYEKIKDKAERKMILNLIESFSK